MRELIRYMRNAAEFAQPLGKIHIDEDIARNVVNQQRQDIMLRLNVNHREALKRILQQGQLTSGQHDEVEDELLRSLHLLSYRDHRDSSWFDVLPNILPLL